MNATVYDSLSPTAAAKASALAGSGTTGATGSGEFVVKDKGDRGDKDKDKNSSDDPETASKGSAAEAVESGYDPYQPEDNCFLRIHIPYPGGSVVPANENGRKCADVVLFS